MPGRLRQTLAGMHRLQRPGQVCTLRLKARRRACVRRCCLAEVRGAHARLTACRRLAAVYFVRAIAPLRARPGAGAAGRRGMSSAVQAKLAAMRAFNGVMGALKKHREAPAPGPAGGAHVSLHAGQGLPPLVATQGFSAHDIEELGGRLFEYRRQPVRNSSCTVLAGARVCTPTVRACERERGRAHTPQGTCRLHLRDRIMQKQCSIYARVQEWR